MPRLLLTGDLHLTDRKEDNYRWGIFDLLKEQADENNVDHIYILGDLTHFKDNHSSYLINEIVDSLRYLAFYHPVTIIMGNHDYLPGSPPTFEFLNEENLMFVSSMQACKLGKTNIALVPHCSFGEYVHDSWWEDAISGEYDLVLAHETVQGSVVANGQVLDGTDLSNSLVPIISGDIHQPQSLGPVTYVGSPYHTKFGEDFNPRLLVADIDVDNIECHSISINRFPNKLTADITTLEELESFIESNAKENDQIKVRMYIGSSHVHKWSEFKKQIVELCNHRELDLQSAEIIEESETQPISEITSSQSINTTYTEYFEDYCKQEGVDGYVYDLGKEIVDGE